MFGTICWRFEARRKTQQDIFNYMGSIYAAVLFIGITNATAVQPVVSVERFVSYIEKAVGMYLALPFAFVQNDDHDSLQIIMWLPLLLLLFICCGTSSVAL